MKVITSFAANKGSGTVDSVGVHIERPDNSPFFKVLIPGQGEIAWCTAGHLIEMTEAGDVLNEPVFTFKSGSGNESVRTIGGKRVLRCEVQVLRNGLWLVPCGEVETVGILLFYQWDEWMTDGRVLKTGSGAKLLATLEDKTWRKHWSVIAMAPGGSFELVTNGTRAIPGTGPDALHWFRKRRRETYIKNVKLISLSPDGNTLIR